MLNRENYLKMFQPDALQYFESLPYEICHDSLYTPEELIAGYDPERPETLSQCFDFVVFRHFSNPPQDSTLAKWERWAQNAHDTAISIAVNRMFQQYDISPRKVVGIMGGHLMARRQESYRKIALMSKRLTELGYLMTSGGGPGAMEAVHFGAHMAGRTETEFNEAMKILSVANFYTEPEWMASSCRVKKRFPADPKVLSLAIPTWLFGREPPTVFPSHIAKFFSNSIREDTLLTSSFGGIILMPGSAGTFREIFQKIVQNHYLTWKYPSPMVFIGQHYWTHSVPLYPVIQDMLQSRNVKNLLTALVDSVEDAVELICDFEKIYPLLRAKRNAALTKKLTMDTVKDVPK